MPALADGGAHAVAHGNHRHIHSQGEQPHAPHQQNGAKQKQHQRTGVQGSDGDRQQKNDGGDGKHRGHGLLYLFHKLFVKAQGHQLLSG